MDILTIDKTMMMDIDGVIENQTIRIATIVEAIIKSGNFDNTETKGKIILGK